MHTSFIIVAIIALILLWLVFYFIPIGYYFMTKTSGVDMSLADHIKLKNRSRVHFPLIVDCLAQSAKEGLGLSLGEVESAANSGVDIRNILYAMVSAKQAGLKLTFQQGIEASKKGVDVFAVTLEAIEKKKELNL